MVVGGGRRLINFFVVVALRWRGGGGEISEKSRAAKCVGGCLGGCGCGGSDWIPGGEVGKKELPALSLARPRQAGDLFLSLLSVSLSLSCSSFSPRKSGPSLRQVIVDLPPHTGELPPWLKLSLVGVSPLAVVAGRGLSWKRTAVELERSHYTQSCLLSFERH